MKIVLDIPEKVVTAIQNGEDYRYDIHTAIAQGIPYEEKPQGDLISREALKNYARKVLWEEHPTNYTLIRLFDNIIDNAPTIAKINTNDIEYKAYCRGLEDGKKIARPQGE